MTAGRQLWIPQALRDYGLTVIEHSGWNTRGAAAAFDPRGVVVHHTGGVQGSPNPSLGICLNGRGQPNPLPGPLCHVLLGRDCLAHVIASGKANHAGEGGPLLGVPHNLGNECFLGIEEENDGTGEPRTDAQLDALTRASAALMDGCGAPAPMCIGHKEWTIRKVDPAQLDMNTFRAAVTAARARHQGEPPAMPTINDFGPAMDTLDEIYLLERGTFPTTSEREEWAADIYGKLGQGLDLRPTWEYIAYTLQQEKTGR